MFCQKKGITGISLIIYGVIGLVILVLVSVMLGSKIGDFSKGKERAQTCGGACSAAGEKYSGIMSKKGCDLAKGKVMGGDFYDVKTYEEPCYDPYDPDGCTPSSEPKACCCYG